MDLAELKEVAQRTFLKKIKMELEKNKHYFISAIKQVQTRYGKKRFSKPQKLEESLDAVVKLKLYIYHIQKGAFEFKIDCNAIFAILNVCLI